MTAPALVPTDRLSLLYHLSQVFNSSLDLNGVLDRVMEEVLNATHAERGLIALTVADKEPEFYAARGWGGEDSPEYEKVRKWVETFARDGQSPPTAKSDAPTTLLLPIQWKEAAVGYIYADKGLADGTFTADDVGLVEAIAAAAVSSIENARLFSAVENQIQELRLLQHITRDLTSTLDLERVLTGCLRQVQDTLGAETSSILMVEGDELVFTIALGSKAAEVKPFRVSVDEGIAGWVVRNARGTFVNNAHDDPRFFSGVDKVSGYVTRELMAAPLTMNDRVIGVVEVSNRVGGFTGADLDLLSTIAASAAIAIENARLYKVAVEKGRLEHELKVARDVQASLIPQSRPELAGWEFDAHWIPAREVSGDFYDFIQSGAGQLGLVLADVSDKGMAAALFMALTRSIVRASTVQAESAAQGIMAANRLVCADAGEGMFVTLFYGRLAENSGDVVYVNAGQNPPLVYSAARNDLTELTRTGMAIGIFPVNRFQERTIHLEPGDFIFAYTDGVTEAMNAQGEEFGEERLKALILAHAHKTPAEISRAVQEAVNGFIGQMPQSDDITFGVVKRV